MQSLSMKRTNVSESLVCTVMLSGVLQSALSEEGIFGTVYIGLLKILMASHHGEILQEEFVEKQDLIKRKEPNLRPW